MPYHQLISPKMYICNQKQSWSVRDFYTILFYFEISNVIIVFFNWWLVKWILLRLKWKRFNFKSNFIKFWKSFKCIFQSINHNNLLTNFIKLLIFLTVYLCFVSWCSLKKISSLSIQIKVFATVLMNLYFYFVCSFCVKSNIEVLSENIYTSLEKAIFKNELQGWRSYEIMKMNNYN